MTVTSSYINLTLSGASGAVIDVVVLNKVTLLIYYKRDNDYYL